MAISGKDKGINLPALFCALLAGLVTFLVYLPALKLGFVNWDDPSYVYENLNIRSIDWAFIKWVCTAVVRSIWHPLTMTSLAVDYSLWGLNPFGYHLVNNIFHALNSALVAYAGFRMAEGVKGDNTRSAFTGLLAGLLFGLHPLHVESVAWVSERKDVLSTFFFLLSVIAYMRYVGLNLKKCYAISLFFFVLSLLSKPMAVTMPVVLLIMDFYPLKRLTAGNLKRVILEKVPFGALSALFVGLTIWGQQGAITLGTSDGLPLTVRLLTAARATAFYLYKMAVPTNLSPFYPYNQFPEIISIEYGGALVLLAVLTVLPLFLLNRSRALLAAWLFYIATLLPVIGIIQVGGQSAADRYTYIPSISLFVLFGAGVMALAGRAGKGRVTFAIGVAAALALLAVLTLPTINQIGIWKNSVALWTRGTALYPEGVPPIPQYNLGTAYEEVGEYEKALDAYALAVKADPYFTMAHVNRGRINFDLGRYEAAANDYMAALRVDPRDAASHYSLGLVYMKMGDNEKSQVCFSNAQALGMR